MRLIVVIVFVGYIVVVVFVVVAVNIGFSCGLIKVDLTLLEDNVVVFIVIVVVVIVDNVIVAGLLFIADNFLSNLTLLEAEV